MATPTRTRPRLRRSPRPASATPSRTFMLLLGGAGVLGAALLAWVGINAPNSIPGRSYYTLNAQLAEADNVTAHSQVRMAGRLIGQVLKPEVRDGHATVELQLDPDVRPLRADTTLRVRPRSPIGVRFIELVPGRRGAPLAEGATIPAGQTSAALPLDTVLGTLDPPTRQRTAELLRALGGGFAGRGEDLNEALGSGATALHDAAAVSRAIAARPTASRGFVRGAATAAAAADPVREVIAGGFRPEARALRPLADEGDAMADTLDVAPSALAATRSGLAATSPMLRATTALARDALPLLRSAPGSLARTASLLRDGRPGVRKLEVTLGLARRAVAPTLALLRTARPVLPAIDRTLKAATPILTELGPRRCDMQLMLRNFESVLGWGDGVANYLRFNVIGSAESVTGQQEAGRLPAGTRTNPYPAPCTVRQDRLKAGGPQ